MRITVDHDVCVGANQCVMTAPEVFADNDEGLSTVRSGREHDGVDPLARQAAAACPVRAITISEDHMTSTAEATKVSFTDLYVQIQQFYAGQVRCLDGMRADDFAATFTEQGRFDHAPGRPTLEGRRAIAEEMRAYQQQRYVEDPCQRRHWFSMLQIFPQADGSIVTEYYALVLLTRPGQPVPTAAPSCFVRDVLVLENGELLTRDRKVVPDYAV